MFKKIKSGLESIGDKIQLSKTEKVAVWVLLGALTVGQVIIYIKRNYNPLLLDNLRVIPVDDDVATRPRADQILDAVNQKIDEKEAQASRTTPTSVTVSEPKKETPTAMPIEKININTASIGELEKLPGVGPALAQRIIDYRIENDGFKRPTDIQKVSGIGRKTYVEMRNMISVGE